MLRLNSKVALSAASILLGVGSMVLDLFKDKSKVDEAAEKAAKIVLDQIKKN